MTHKNESEIAARVIELRRQGMSIRDIAHDLTMSKSAVGRLVAKHNQGAKGEPPPPMAVGEVVDRTDVDGTIELLKLERPATVEELMTLCKLDPKRWIPQYMKANVWQGYGKIKMPNGESFKKVQLYQSKATFKRAINEELEEAILQFVRENVGAIKKPSVRKVQKRKLDPQMLAFGLWDAHMGSYAWGSECGKDWDCDLACHRIFNSVDDVITELVPYNIERVLMPVGNDLLHSDSVRNTTALHDHPLDVDTRFARVYLAGFKCKCYMIERALEIADEVEILYIPGNHDTTASFTICVALAQRYANDPRVKVDLSANPRKYRTHGGVLIGFDHGSYPKLDRLPLLMATEAIEDWSNSTYRECQIGHKHQRMEKMYGGVIDHNGVLVRMNPSLCNVDIWHHRQGFINNPQKSVEAWRYDKVGYRGSHVAFVRDGKHEVAGAFMKKLSDGAINKDIV